MKRKTRKKKKLSDISEFSEITLWQRLSDKSSFCWFLSHSQGVSENTFHAHLQSGCLETALGEFWKVECSIAIFLEYLEKEKEKEKIIQTQTSGTEVGK